MSLHILVVDDSDDNLKAAMNYFSTLGVNVDYASSGAQAVDLIKQHYKSHKYDIVITDLEMESKESGRNVVYEALAHQTVAIIATGRQGSGGHGPAVNILPLNYSIAGYKNDIHVWEKIYAVALEHHQKTNVVLSRRYKLIGTPDYSTAKMILSTYT